MRTFSLFVLLILLALLLSALINYPLYQLLQDSISSGPHKLINTTGKLIAIPGFIYILYRFSLANKKDLGYALPRAEFLRDVFNGWLSGLVILALLSAALLLLEIRTPKALDDDFAYQLFKTLLVALVGGLLIGLIEETFFRGGLFSGIRRQHGFAATAILSALFYAWMHFIKPLPITVDENLGWFSGLVSVMGAFNQYADWLILDSFLALFVLGLFFALVRERTGNIAYCIGLHAAFVFVIKSMKKFTSVDFDNPFTFLVGSYDGMIGYLSAAGLVIHMILVYHFWRRPKLATQNRPRSA